MTLERNGDQRTLPPLPGEIQETEVRLMGDDEVQRNVALTQRMVAGENTAWIEIVT